MQKVIENFITSEECKEFIERAESNGMEEALLYTPDGAEKRSDYRSNDRFIFDDPELASKLWQRIEHQCEELQDEGSLWTAYGLNEKFKIYRYRPEQYFALHSDHPFTKNKNEKSFQTLIIYLNEDFEGGETSFIMGGEVSPSIGKATLFHQHLLHEGVPVTSGTKYALRTDVMYRRKS